jgi:hypothetical protein
MSVGYLAWRGMHTTSLLPAQLAYAVQFLASVILAQ